MIGGKRDYDKCFICQSPESQKDKTCPDNILGYRCKYCGLYFIATDAAASLDRNPERNREFSLKAPSLAAERNIQRKTPFTIRMGNHERPFVDGHDFLNDFPEDFEEKVQRSLLNLFHTAKPLQTVEFNGDHARLFFGESYDDSWAVVKVLKSLGYIELINSRRGEFFFDACLTYEGWKAARQLNKAMEEKSTVFIAMWFDDSTKAFRDATSKAITLAGFKPIIIDEVSHNDYIMDKVINLINEARFVIADFSCRPETIEGEKVKNGVRGGVYYEAGYAKGLGIEVIHTCNKDSFPGRLHFDIQQKNTIVWEEKDGKIVTNGNDYIQYLKEHILATVGKGKGL